ncbi:MAG: SdiA-regulated domain-containing protein [Bacteroidia bacterium]|nr:SdiA-regulated domain-containing protein [Bacteroidia bacterium]
MPAAPIAGGWVLPYRLDAPDLHLTLEPALSEVSGIAWDGARLLALQDEAGILFALDPATGNTLKKWPIAGLGDFEDVEVAEGKVYMLKSNGILLEVSGLDTPGQTVREIRTPLSEADDLEGLGYLASERLLLIAAKEPPMEGGLVDKRFRRVYGYALPEGRLNPQPRYQIGMAEIKAVLTAQASDEKSRARAAEFDPESKKSFKPAGVAVHPLHGDVYIVAAAGQLLAVLGADGTLKGAFHLKKSLFPQPEGICFDPEGRMYISNEAETGGTLLVFSMQP